MPFRFRPARSSSSTRATSSGCAFRYSCTSGANVGNVVVSATNWQTWRSAVQFDYWPYVTSGGHVESATMQIDWVNTPGNDTLTITVLDEPGHGGANHAYDIEGGEAVPTHLRFQNGPISADGNGVNGMRWQKRKTSAGNRKLRNAPADFGAALVFSPMF